MSIRMRSILAVCLVFLFYLISMLYFLIKEYNGNYSGFLHISDELLEKNPLTPPSTENLNLILVQDGGYDGQLFYFIAYDPFLTALQDARMYRQMLDLPGYRYRRIGYPLLTYLFSFRHPEFYPAVMMWLILASHIVGALFLAKIAIASNQDPLWALLYILIPGYSFSLMYGLPESLAGALLLAGFYFYLKKRVVLSCLTFAASLLFRETGILFIGFVGLMEAIRTKRPGDAWKPWISVLPYFAWRLYVTFKLLPDAGWAGFFKQPQTLTIPFTGVVELFATISRGEYPQYIVPAGLLLPLLLAGAGVLAIWSMREKITIPAIAVVAYTLLALTLNFEQNWIHIGNVERLSYESFLCLILVFLMTGNTKLRKVFLAYFVVLFLYDFLLSSADRSFRAAIHWVFS